MKNLYKLMVLVFMLVLMLSLSSAVMAEEEINLRWFFWGHSEDLPHWKQGINEFMENHPNVNVDIENSPWSRYWTKLQTQAVSGSMADIVGMVSMKSDKFIKQGSLLNLAPYIERDNYKIDDFWPTIMEAYKHDGGIYALPYDLSTSILLCNVDLFEEAGVEVPIDGWSWDEFVTAAKKLTKDSNNDGDIDQYGVYALENDWTIFNFLLSNGSEITNEDGTKLLLNEPAAVEAIQKVADLRLKHEVSPRYSPNADELGLFESGKLAMTTANPEWVMLRKERMPNTKLAAVPIPTLKKEAYAVAGGAFAASADTEHPDMAWQFLKEYVSKDALERIVGKTHRGIPGRRSIADSMLESPNAVRGSENFMKVLDKSTWVNFNNYAEIMSLLKQYLEEIYIGDKPVQKAMDQFVNEANKLLVE